MRTPLRLLAVASVALLLLAGCVAAPDAAPDGSGGSTVDPGGTDSSTLEGPPDLENAGNAAAWCDLASPSLIGETLGLQMQEPIASFTAEEVHCDYLPVEAGGATLAVQFLLGHDHDTFAAYRDQVENPSEPSADLAGVGDEGFYRRSEFGSTATYVAAARKGTVVVLVDAPSSLDEVTDLMVQVLAQLV
jgi:hypothetical protein